MGIASSLVFSPPKCSYDTMNPYPVTWIQTISGKNIPAYYLKTNKSKVHVLYSHGNATDMGQMIDFLILLRDHVGVNVLHYEYTGYGLSTTTTGTGGTKQDDSPSEQDTYECVESAFEYLVYEQGVSPSDIIVFGGPGVGSGPSVHLASRVSGLGGLILESPMTSVVDLWKSTGGSVAKIVGGMMSHWNTPSAGSSVSANDSSSSWNMFCNLEKMSRVTCPVLILHGKNDNVVPVEHAWALYERIPNKYRYELQLIDGADHQDLIEVMTVSRYANVLSQFLDHCDTMVQERMFVSPPKRHDDSLSLFNDSQFFVNESFDRSEWYRRASTRFSSARRKSVAAPSTSIASSTNANLKAYMFVYNLILAIGWIIVMGFIIAKMLRESVNFVRYLSRKSTHRDATILNSVIPTILSAVSAVDGVFYNLFSELKPLILGLEIILLFDTVHALLGFWGQDTVAPLHKRWYCKVGRRAHLLLFALCIAPAEYIEHSSFLGFTIFTWALTDCVRYPYYALNLYRVCPRWITWLRYTNFIIQYPLNVVAENLYIFFVLFPACASYGAHLRFHIQVGRFVDFYLHYGYVYAVSKLVYDNLRFPSSFKTLWVQMKKRLYPRHSKVL